MKRVAIIGCGGAGKSTLASRLGEHLGVPVHHLDHLFWKAGWKESTREEFIAKQEAIFTSSAWIIDGNYGGTMDLRLNAADTIIFLDLSMFTCLAGAVRRYVRYRKRVRPDMTAGNPDRLTFEYLRFIFSYRWTRRPTILRRLAGVKDSKTVVVLDSRSAVERFTARLRAP